MLYIGIANIVTIGVNIIVSKIITIINRHTTINHIRKRNVFPNLDNIGFIIIGQIYKLKLP